MSELEDKIGETNSLLRDLVGRIDESRAGKAGTDTARETAAKAGIEAEAAKLTEAATEKADVARKADIADAVKAALADLREPSKAALIGAPGGSSAQGQPRQIGRFAPSPMLKGAFADDYVSGDLLTAILDINSIETQGIDLDAIARGKAMLQRLSLAWQEPAGKATLGATGATGGYVLPNNLVDTLIKPNTQEALYTSGSDPLVTVVNGVNVRGVDMPYRTGAPTRMTFQDWGATKENVDEAYGSYTATLGTLARIYDIGKQYARFSAGSAERDVMDELTKAAALAENYYVIKGAGTGSTGVGDPTTGVYTALAAVFGAYTTAFSGASGSTVAGSAAAAFASALGSLAARSRQATAIVTDATTFWTILAQGSDAAGFWVDPTGGPTGFTRTASGGLSFWGVPLYYDANLNTNTSTSKFAIAGDWKALKFYRGMEFRIDSSDVAGTRWDKNLIGFRGEEEIAVNAYPAVFTGAFQLITGLIA